MVLVVVACVLFVVWFVVCSLIVLSYFVLSFWFWCLLLIVIALACWLYGYGYGYLVLWFEDYVRLLVGCFECGLRVLLVFVYLFFCCLVWIDLCLVFGNSVALFICYVYEYLFVKVLYVVSLVFLSDLMLRCILFGLLFVGVVVLFVWLSCCLWLAFLRFVYFVCVLFGLLLVLLTGFV